MSTVSQEIKNYLTSLYGEISEKQYSEFIKQDPSVYLRVNTLKTNKSELIKSLKDQYGIICSEIENLPNALKVIEGEKVIGKTLQHITGKFYIQSLSSMIPALVLSPNPNDKVLDLCAAPGSKTTGLGELMQNKGTLVANEISQNRVSMLVFNIDRINLLNTAVTHNRGEWLSRYFSEYFDKILVDAPCSGLGILHKRDEVSDWWSLKRAQELGELQYRLLVSAIKMLQVGGELIYSTCTLTIEENELIVDKILNKYPLEIKKIDLPVKSIPGFTEHNGIKLNPSLNLSKRIIPWEVDSDGFFIVKFIKNENTASPEQVKTKIRSKVFSTDNPQIKEYLQNIYDDFGVDENVLRDYKFILNGNNIFFINKDFELENIDLFHRFGVRFGKIDNHNNTILHSQAAELLKNDVTKNIYELKNTDELKIYINGGTIKDFSIKGRQCAVKYKNDILGTAAVTNTGLKSRFPRAKRTQNIIIE